MNTIVVSGSDFNIINNIKKHIKNDDKLEMESINNNIIIHTGLLAPEIQSHIWIRKQTNSNFSNEIRYACEQKDKHNLAMVCIYDVKTSAPTTGYHIVVFSEKRIKSFQSEDDMYKYILEYVEKY